MEFKNAKAVVNCIIEAVILMGKNKFEEQVMWSLVVCSYESGTGQLFYSLRMHTYNMESQL